jgi:hypothetical protein
MGHGSLPKFPPTRAAFARPGPGLIPFPDVIAPMQPSDSLPPSATALVPLAGGLPRCGRLFCAFEADDTCRASETGHRLSATPECIEERRGPPRVRGRPLRPCHGRTPRRLWSTPRPHHGEAIVAFRYIRTLGIREGERFRGRMPHGPHVRLPPHRRWPFGHRRKASYRPGGLTLGRAGFAPTGRHTKFHEGIASSSPN